MQLFDLFWPFDTLQDIRNETNWYAITKNGEEDTK
jgi:hypothetical protein